LTEYVLDSSGILAALLEEPGRPEVEGLLESASEAEGPTLWLPFMAAMEVEYRLNQVRPSHEVIRVLEMMGGWPVRLVESDPRWRHEAARIKLNYSLSVADAWIAALALLRGALLVHKDPEFDPIEGLQHLRLPYKAKQA
jgi:predicted nucleic acid-binding protein